MRAKKKAYAHDVAMLHLTPFASLIYRRLLTCLAVFWMSAATADSYKLLLDVAEPGNDICEALDRNIQSLKPVRSMQCSFALNRALPAFTRPEWKAFPIPNLLNLDYGGELKPYAQKWLRNRVDAYARGEDSLDYSTPYTTEVSFLGNGKSTHLIRFVYKEGHPFNCGLTYKKNSEYTDVSYSAIRVWDPVTQAIGGAHSKLNLPYQYFSSSQYDVIEYKGRAYLVTWTKLDNSVYKSQKKRRANRMTNFGLLIEGGQSYRPNNMAQLCFFEYQTTDSGETP